MNYVRARGLMRWSQPTLRNLYVRVLDLVRARTVLLTHVRADEERESSSGSPRYGDSAAEYRAR